MKLSHRESWMIALGVPVLVLLLAELAVLPSLRKKTTSATQSAAAKGTPAMWQSQLAQAQDEVTKIRDEIDAQRTALEAKGMKVDHGAALKEVSELCTACGLSLVSSVQDGQPVAIGLKPALAVITERNGGHAPEAWCVSVEGTYPQVRKLVSAMAASKAWIVPLNLGMKVDEEGLRPTVWALTLWL